jgi:stage V sporulation protein AC
LGKIFKNGGFTVTDSKKYKALIKKHTPSSPLLKNCSLAFLFGGGICFGGELLATLFLFFGIEEADAYSLVTATLIVIASFLTAIGVFDRIAKHAGAGTLLPVTGFANSVTSPALDARSEGFILGVGAKIFTVAGPVILFATAAGTLYGFIYYLLGLFIK